MCHVTNEKVLLKTKYLLTSDAIGGGCGGSSWGRSGGGAGGGTDGAASGGKGGYAGKASLSCFSFGM